MATQKTPFGQNNLLAIDNPDERDVCQSQMTVEQKYLGQFSPFPVKATLAN